MVSLLLDNIQLTREIEIWYNIGVKFIDREQEMGRLVRLMREQRGGFAAIWGRRRIGKSELLKEWCRRFDSVYTVADQSLAAVQRSSFALALSERFAGWRRFAGVAW